MLLAYVQVVLGAMPADDGQQDGYLCREVEGGLRYMAAFRVPARALEWCLLMQVRPELNHITKVRWGSPATAVGRGLDAGANDPALMYPGDPYLLLHLSIQSCLGALSVTTVSTAAGSCSQTVFTLCCDCEQMLLTLLCGCFSVRAAGGDGVDPLAARAAGGGRGISGSISSRCSGWWCRRRWAAPPSGAARLEDGLGRGSAQQCVSGSSGEGDGQLLLLSWAQEYCMLLLLLLLLLVQAVGHASLWLR